MLYSRRPTFDPTPGRTSLRAAYKLRSSPARMNSRILGTGLTNSPICPVWPHSCKGGLISSPLRLGVLDRETRDPRTFGARIFLSLVTRRVRKGPEAAPKRRCGYPVANSAQLIPTRSGMARWGRSSTQSSLHRIDPNRLYRLAPYRAPRRTKIDRLRYRRNS